MTREDNEPRTLLSFVQKLPAYDDANQCKDDEAYLTCGLVTSNTVENELLGEISADERADKHAYDAENKSGYDADQNTQ
jgi:hypothetical protein